MLTKEKRNKLIGDLLTLTMGTTLVAGCSNEEENNEEWQNDNAAVQQSSDNSFWGMVTAFGLGYALSHMFSGPQTPQVPPKQPPAYTSTTKPGNNTQTKTSTANGENISNTQNKTNTTTSKVAAPSSGKTGIGSSSIRSHAVS